MNILYVVYTFSVIEPLGVMSLSAVTRRLGHASFLASLTHDDIPTLIRTQNIRLVAFSMLSTETADFLQLASQIKTGAPQVTIIAGGPHPTYFPEIIEHPALDAIVRGEGEAAITDIVNALDGGQPLDGIANVHTRKIRANPRPLCVDLDTLPFADRALAATREPFQSIRMKTFFATRGCPFHCSYCFNNAYSRLYQNDGPVIRRRSVASLIREISEVTRRYPTDFIRFGDDAFVLKNDDWLKDFTAQYQARIRLPFYLLINPSVVTPDIIRLLRHAGCHSLMMGIETGSERLRRDIFQRPVSNQTILNAFQIVRSHNIKIFSNTILGLPDSSIEDDLYSLEFTLRCRPYYAGFTILTPFPGTDIYEYSRKNGYLPVSSDPQNATPFSLQADSCLTHITPQRQNIERNILVLGCLANRFPFLKNIIRKQLIFWRPNPLFNALGFLVRNYQNMRIFPFGKNCKSFLSLALLVLRIDGKNYKRQPAKNRCEL